MDLVRPESSIVVAAGQHLSGLAQGLPSSAMVLWRHAGSESLEAWMLRGAELELFGVVLLHMATGLRRRHGGLSRSSVKLVSLADDRVSEHDRNLIVEELRSTPACCLPHGPARDLSGDRGIPDSARILVGLGGSRGSTIFAELRLPQPTKENKPPSKTAAGPLAAVCFDFSDFCRPRFPAPAPEAPLPSGAGCPNKGPTRAPALRSFFWVAPPATR